MNLLILELLAGCIAILCFSMLAQAQVQDRPHVTGYPVGGYISENADNAGQRFCTRHNNGANDELAGGADRTTFKTVTLPDASTIDYRYDDAHRLTGIADGVGNTTAYTLDAKGNRLTEQVSDPAGNLTRQTTRVFDVLGRMRQITGGMQ